MRSPFLRPAIKRCRSASEKGANEFGAHDRAPGTHAVNLRTKKSILASAALAGLDFGVHAAGYCETRAFKSICTSAYLSSQTSSMRHPVDDAVGRIPSTAGRSIYPRQD